MGLPDLSYKIIPKRQVMILAKKQKKEAGCDCGQQHQPGIEETTEENNFLLHVLIDYLIEREIISEAEFQDRLDLVESELFVDEQSCKPKPKKSPAKKSKAQKKPKKQKKRK